MKSRSNQQVSFANGRSSVCVCVCAVWAEVQAEFSLSCFLSSGRGETQRLLLDEQFHERDAQTERESSKRMSGCSPPLLNLFVICSWMVYFPPV